VKAGKQGQMLAVAKADSLREGQKDPFSVDDPEIKVIEIEDATVQVFNADPNLTDHSIHIEFI
jgi:hypothetical protein